MRSSIDLSGTCSLDTVRSAVKLAVYNGSMVKIKKKYPVTRTREDSARGNLPSPESDNAIIVYSMLMCMHNMLACLYVCRDVEMYVCVCICVFMYVSIRVCMYCVSVFMYV